MRQTIRAIHACLTAAALTAAAVGPLAGCHRENDTTGRGAELFREEGEVSEVTRIKNQEIAAGSRTDATLRAYHFYHGGLNSLGREKLDSMLAFEQSGGPLVVYVDVPATRVAADPKLADLRLESVSSYLTDHGLDQEAFRLETGPNPDNTTWVEGTGPKAGDGNDPADAPSTGFGAADAAQTK